MSKKMSLLTYGWGGTVEDGFILKFSDGGGPVEKVVIAPDQVPLIIKALADYLTNFNMEVQE